MRIFNVAFYMEQDEWDRRVQAMDPAQLAVFDAALLAFRPVADSGDMIFLDTPELAALTDALKVTGFPDPILLYPGSFTVRTMPGDFGRWLARTTGTTYRFLGRRR